MLTLRIRFLLTSLSNKKNEIQSLYEILLSLTHQIDELCKKGILSKNKKNQNLLKCEQLLVDLSSFENPLRLRSLVHNFAPITKKIASIRHKLLKIMEECGAGQIEDILYCLYPDFKKILKNQTKEYQDNYYFLNRMFSPISYSLMDKNDSIFEEYKLKKYETPVCFPLKRILLSIIEHVHGSRIYFPNFASPYIKKKNKQELVLYGYFKKDMLNISKILDCGTIGKKNEEILEILFKINRIPSKFSTGFIEQLSIRDFMIYDKMTLVTKTLDAYDLLEQMKEKPISKLVKEFLEKNIEQQRDVLTLLLLQDDDLEIQYLAYLMYDMISNESYMLKPQPLAERVYDSLHWSIQKLFKYTIKKVSKITNIQGNQFELDNIPIEKKVCLLKVSDKVKNKAMDKVKEIQNKGGDSSAKAQQYLDGLLRIPFGIYKRERILKAFGDIKKQAHRIMMNIPDYTHKNDSSLISTQDILQLIECKEEQCLVSKETIDKINNFWNTKKVKDKRKLFLEFKSSDYTKTFITKANKVKLDKLFQTQLLKKETQKDFIYHIQKIYDFHCDNCSLTEFKTLWSNYQSNVSTYLSDVMDILNKAVYKQEDAKREIQRIFAQWISGKEGGYCLGFEGPPGTGKTSLAKQGIAKCLRDSEGKTRPFAFIAVGGSANASTFEGHSYTYVGSTWGKIVDILMETECMNPIIYIDELDKISNTENGKEIIGLLTHITDPSQNNAFQEKYFSGIPLDLSKVLFIFSYNDYYKIDPILADRIHRIKFHRLDRNDKKTIVNQYMLPELLDMVGFSKNAISFSDETLEWLIDSYTCEAGVRKCKERIFELVRQTNLDWMLQTNKQHETIFPLELSKSMVETIFQNRTKIERTRISDKPRVGMVNGLFASTSGLGGLTLIEVYQTLSDNILSLELTGQQGDVMKESVKCARTIAWNLLTPIQQQELKKEWKEKDAWGIHVHCPEAATPKDGPSAGCAITLAIYSLLLKRPVKHNIAMTGEIDLNGKALKIGGLDMKIDGAKMAGVECVICPEANKDDIEWIIRNNPALLDNIQIKMVTNIKEIIEIALI